MIVVREASEADAAAMVALLNPIIAAGTYTAMDEPITIDAQREWLREFPARGVLRVAELGEDGHLAGMQDVVPLPGAPRVSDHVGVISTFVALDARGRGIGRALTEVTFAAAAAQGFRKLCASIRADNPEALAFYRRMGFTVIGIAREHVRLGGRYVDEVLTERLLV